MFLWAVEPSCWTTAFCKSCWYQAAWVLLTLNNHDVTTIICNFFLNVFSCLLYKYLSVDGFPAALGVDAVCRLDNRLPRVCPTEQLTPSHPRMATCSGSDVSGTSVSSLSWALRHSSLCSHHLVLYIQPGRLPEGLCTYVHPTVAPSLLQLCACVPCCSRHPKAVSHMQRACKDMVRVVLLSPELQRRLVCSTGILHRLAMGSGTGDPHSAISLPSRWKSSCPCLLPSLGNTCWWRSTPTPTLCRRWALL